MDNHDVRLTQPTLKVLRYLLETPREGRSGVEMSKATKIGSGTLYPMLARMEANGWLRSTRTGEGKARRSYRITPAGERLLARLRAEIDELHREVVRGVEPKHAEKK